MKDKDKIVFKLYHFTEVKNVKSILNNGLLIRSGNEKGSGYGNVPRLNAVYLFHEDNIYITMDMVNVFRSVALLEVDITREDIKYLEADEDSECSTWEESIERMHTCCILRSIDPNRIRHLYNIESNIVNLNFKSTVKYVEGNIYVFIILEEPIEFKNKKFIEFNNIQIFEHFEYSVMKNIDIQSGYIYEIALTNGGNTLNYKRCGKEIDEKHICDINDWNALYTTMTGNVLYKNITLIAEFEFNE